MQVEDHEVLEMHVFLCENHKFLILVIILSYVFSANVFFTFSNNLHTSYSLVVLSDGTCSCSLDLSDICSAFILDFSALCCNRWSPADLQESWRAPLSLSPVDLPSLRNTIGSDDAFYNVSGG